MGGGVITFAFGERPELTMRVAAGAATVAAAERYLKIEHVIAAADTSVSIAS